MQYHLQSYDWQWLNLSTWQWCQIHFQCYNLSRQSKPGQQNTLSTSISFKQQIAALLTEQKTASIPRKSFEWPSRSLRKYSWRLLKRIYKKACSGEFRLQLFSFFIYYIFMYVCTCFTKSIFLFLIFPHILKSRYIMSVLRLLHSILFIVHRFC